MATGTIESQYATTTGTITKYSGITTGTFEQLCCVKVGSVVNACARIYNCSETATGTFFVLPSGFRPSQRVYGSGFIQIGGTFIPIYVQITTAGEVAVSYSGSQTLTFVAFTATFAI